MEAINVSKLFIGYWNVSVILTYIELCSAVFGISRAADGKFTAAVLALLFCGLCDMFDGKIARAISRSEDAKCFGIQIDSLCDLVSFGVLPSTIGHAVGIGGAGVIVLMLYTLAALVRLGYFNVSEIKRQQQTSQNRTEFEGLPVTWSAVIVPLTVLLAGRLSAFPWIFGVVLAVTATLFLARIRVKKPQI